MAKDYETNKGCNLKDYLKKDDWKIIEDQFHPEYNQISESIFSIGNGRMGQRANFEEDFSGRSLQGSYIAGIYYPDKTKVGWWKIGYPEYFAKVVNSVNWIGLRIEVNGKQLDLNHVEVLDFERILDMKNGLLQRRTKVKLDPKTVIEISSERFYSYSEKDKAFLHYKITNIGKKLRLNIKSFLDFGIRNQDANYNEKFWKQEAQFVDSDSYWIQANTKKTGFSVRAAQKTRAFLEDQSVNPKNVEDDALVGHEFEAKLKEGETVILTKYTAICTSFYYEKNDLEKRAAKTLESAVQTGYEKSKKAHSAAWNAKWQDMDVAIEGDVAAQQGIRYTIFQLHQTYTGEDPRLNIGPKGFTGEKYGGCTYWDTEAYCLPFYLSTAKETVGKNLLKYRFDHLPKAIENAKKLGFGDGAALFPMVTMTGEECHNEWEITFEEIHRNGVMAYAIFDYVRYTGNKSYIPEYGLEVLVAISRFWAQRVTWSEIKDGCNSVCRTRLLFYLDTHPPYSNAHFYLIPSN